MTHSPHWNYKIWIIIPFHTVKTAANANIRLCLKSELTSRINLAMPDAHGSELLILDTVYKSSDRLEKVIIR